jgi:hypothetical protein
MASLNSRMTGFSRRFEIPSQLGSSIFSGLIGAACSGGARQRASVPGERPFRLEEPAGVELRQELREVVAQVTSWIWRRRGLTSGWSGRPRSWRRRAPGEDRGQYQGRKRLTAARVAISPGSGITTCCVPYVDSGLSYLYAVFCGAENMRKAGDCSKNGELGRETLSMMLTFLG